MKTKRRDTPTTKRIEPRLAPPKYAERQQSTPGSGHKRARGVMTPRPTR